MDLLLESTLRTSVVLAVALAAIAALRRRSAALRHCILTAAIVGAALTPALNSLIPAWPVPADWIRVELTTTQLVSGPAVPPSRSAVTSARSFSIEPWLVGVWASGAVIVLLRLAIGLARLTWRSVHATEFSGRLQELLAELNVQKPRRIRLLKTPHGTTPMTWGWRRPVILLPLDAEGWGEERIRVVLSHELAHIRRGDWAVQMIAEGLRAFYWLNPLAWMASSRLRLESELACDDAVLATGVEAHHYATHLLEMVRTAGRSADDGVPAAAMARVSSFERRFQSMLRDKTNRSPVHRPVRTVTTAVAFALTVAAAAISAQTFSSFSGSIFDDTNRVVPKIAISLTNPQTGATYSINSGSDGRFQFVGLPPGDYQFEATGAGFQTLRGVVAITGQNIERDLVLSLGSLEETLSIRARASDLPGRPVQRVQRAPGRPAAPQCDSSATVGGNILPPRKLVNVNPVYPEVARASGIGGTVVLDALIGTDGLIREVTPVSSPHPALETAVIEAVRQWEFSGTYLNCVSSEVRMRVTANFSIEP